MKKLRGDDIPRMIDLEEERMQWIRESKPVNLVSSMGNCDRVRIMVDAGWKSRDKAGIGWVVVSATGSLLFKEGKALKAETPLQAEALGLRDAVIWAVKQKVLHLEISSDCLPLVAALADIHKPHHLAKMILNDILSISTSFHCLSISYIPRDFNKIAHGLACKAMNS
ncbi:uncharacterized protein LOC141600528 [Silene latifolia]|uniref:uncharacterized protein LOC141600528 n=1 Tax=Silene latifolia TaxID=37657 RepID=UPI003D7806B4